MRPKHKGVGDSTRGGARLRRRLTKETIYELDKLISIFHGWHMGHIPGGKGMEVKRKGRREAELEVMY